MKKLLLAAFLTGLISASAFAQKAYETYFNDRFSFSIDYPSDLLIMQDPPANNDGRTFLSPNGLVEMRVWGSNNALLRSLKQEYNSAIKDLGVKPSYKLLQRNGFVVSGQKKGIITYQKTLFSDNVFYTFLIEYPAKDKKLYDAMVTRIARSFKIEG